LSPLLVQAAMPQVQTIIASVIAKRTNELKDITGHQGSV